jgi:Uri superfamily endonuclease
MQQDTQSTGIDIPRCGGLYILLLNLEEQTQVAVGRLGRFIFNAGVYAYVGSARGPGGLSARMTRHLRPPDAKRIHWHIDYLTVEASIWAAGWSTKAESRECDWSAALAPLGRRWPSHFGASDCRCAGHLIEIPNQITIQDMDESIPERLRITSLG